MNKVRKITFLGIISALAIVLAVLERYIPLQVVIPLPGVKLGIANVITLVLLLHFDMKSAFMVLLVRCSVVSLLFGTPIGFLMSLSGGIFALFGMALLLRFEKAFSVYGISIAGAALHSIGQLICAMFWMQSAYILLYLPILLLCGVPAGLLIAAIVSGVDKIGIFDYLKEAF